MTSLINFRGRVITLGLLLSVSVLGLSITAYAAPAASSACALNVLPPLAHSSPGAGDSFIIAVIASGGAGCTYGVNHPSWIDPNGIGSNLLTVTVDPNPGPARSGNITILGLSLTNGNYTPTGVQYVVTVTQATLTCTYSFATTVLNFSGENTENGFVQVTASHPACPRNPQSNASWLGTANGASGTGSGQISYSAAANNGPARTGKITLGNATLTVNEANQCAYGFSPTSKQFEATGGTGAINVTASNSACPRNAESNVNWITITGGNNSNGSGPVTYSVLPSSGLARQGLIKLRNATFTVTELSGCTYAFSPNGGITFPAGGGNSTVHVIASSSECVWSPLSGASWVKITNSAQFTGNATLSITVEPNQGTARSTTVSVNGKTVPINQNGSPPADDCTLNISPVSYQFGALGGEVTINVTASKSSCKWYVGAISPFISVLNGGQGGIGSGSVKLKIQPNAGSARSGSADIAGKTFLATQDGVSAQALIITGLNPGFSAAGGNQFQLIVKGANFTSDCHVQWNGKDRPTAFYDNSTLAATISAQDVASEGAFMVSVARSDAESNAEDFMVYGPIANVSSASYSGDGVAPASLVSAFGGDLSKEMKLSNSYPLPTELAGTTVTVTDSTGKVHPAPLFFVSGGQVNYLMPESVALGKATVMITSGSGHTSVGTVEIAAVAPGIFSANSTGKGLAAALVLRIKANGQQVYGQTVEYDQAAAEFKAKPIDVSAVGEQVYLILWGTGLRYRSSLGAVVLDLGGVSYNVLFAGEAPGYFGLDQINLPLSHNLAGRGVVDVTVTADGKKTNSVQLVFK